MVTAPLSWEQYRALDALNWSRLKHLAKSPAHYHWALTDTEDNDTKSLLLGRAVHAAVLEPKYFKERFTIFQGTKRGKAWDEFKAAAELEGQEVLSLKEALHVNALVTSVRQHPAASRLLVGGKPEETIQWTASTPQVLDFPARIWKAKARLDYLSATAIVDLKTAKSAHPDDFARDAWNLGYLGQAAWYTDGVKAATGRALPYFFVVVEKAAPFVVSVFQLPDDLIERGREQYVNLLARLALCETENRWPGYVDGIAPLELPRWVERSEDEDLSDSDIEFGSTTTEEAHGL
jgi:hypothetical protein